MATSRSASPTSVSSSGSSTFGSSLYTIAPPDYIVTSESPEFVPDLQYDGAAGGPWSRYHEENPDIITAPLGVQLTAAARYQFHCLVRGKKALAWDVYQNQFRKAGDPIWAPANSGLLFLPRSHPLSIEAGVRGESWTGGVRPEKRRRRGSF